MDPAGGTGGVVHRRRDLAPDMLADILMRLPPNTRRLLRLVCRHWRDVVGTRTATNLRSRAKTLVATTTGPAYVVDDLSAAPVPGTGHRQLRTISFYTTRRYSTMTVAGTCNGLVCVCDHGGGVTVHNPTTRDGCALPIPLLPPPCVVGLASRRSSGSWQEAYSFAYLPITGRYKVVHVTCHVNRSSYNRVHVITLGDTSWRDVPVGPDAKCDLGYGVVSVDGATYWVAPEGGAKVMCFHLESEHVTSISRLPSVLLSDSENGGGGSWHLAEVHGRLGIVFSHVSSTMDNKTVDKTEVWVMELGVTTMLGERRRPIITWSRWYIVQMSMPRELSSTRIRRLTWPLFIHGDHVLTWEWSSDERGCVLYRHTPINDTTKQAKRGVVDITEKNRGTVVTNIDIAGYNDERRTFGYVETKEQLPI